MGQMIGLESADGFDFAAYEAAPSGRSRGGIVVVQEIFGVNAHIRNVADRFADEGYYAIAPAIFDRAEPAVELGYGPADVERGRAIRQAIALERMVADIDAARGAAASAGKVAVVGYCLGGSLAWIAACRLERLAAAVGYYGGMVAGHLDEKPRCPVMLHFGEADTGIPMSDVVKIRKAVDPATVQIFTYPAGHAFNRDGTPAHHAESARLARERTLAFLAEHVG